MEPVVITEEMLVAHPEYTQAGLTVGDVKPEAGVIIGEEDFAVTEEFMKLNPEYDGKVGDVVKRPILALADVEAEKIDDTKVDEAEKTDEVKTDTVVEEAEVVEDTTPKKYYEGKLIISEALRKHEGLSTTLIRLEDGTTYPLTASEYEAKVKTN